MALYKMLKFKMKVSYQRWQFNLSKGQLLHNAIYKTVVQRQKMAQHALQHYMTGRYNDQHNLFGSIHSRSANRERQMTRQERKQHLARQIKQFHTQIHTTIQLDGGNYDDILAKVWGAPTGKIYNDMKTYGHAMLEFCFFRFHTEQFIKSRIPQMQMNKKLDVFLDMFNMVRGST